ncbi:hypothetical protein [Rheinheimera sp.]|jgi:hypothetical protein|uniref:hypothetical protein n=1 Tax=Rheinheimera sp. TaxID=1869214 RepID=UPI00260F08D9|nr:hypothetical protein [Rheinheimera sp.]MCA1929384.1 hypothetical protein [Rheinheimera sp.]
MVDTATSVHYTTKTQSEFSGWFIIIPLLIALFFPTSINGVINPHLSLIGNLIALIVFFAGIMIGSLRLSLTLFAISLAFMLLLAVMTILSPFSQITLGAVVPYVTFLSVCSINIKSVVFTKAQRRVVIFLIIILLISCFLVVFDFKPFIAFQESYYQMFPDLFDFMMNWAKKPVLMFATHSVAGFAYFLIALILFIFARIADSKAIRYSLFLASISFSVFLVLLLSNTGFILFVVMLLIYLFSMFKAFGVWGWLISLIVLVALVSINIDVITTVLSFAWDSFITVASSKNNGLLARFTLDSRLAGSYEYVFNSPFVGVGFTDHPSLAFGDNLLSEYVLRAGFLGYLLVLILVFGFFYSNLKLKTVAILLFIFVILSDLGYPLFVALRFVFIFPLIIVLSNYYYALKNREHGIA